jgi:hypothetical protein
VVLGLPKVDSSYLKHLAHAYKFLTHSITLDTRYYLYASSDSAKEWQGNHPFCIGSTPSFTIPYANQTQYCGSFVKNFFSVWVPNPVTGILPGFCGYTFAPNNYSINWNSPRAER